MTGEKEWLEYSEILGGKIIAQIEKWSVAYEAKKITKREFFIVISALYDATSGIAPEEVRKLLAKIDEELRAK